MEADIDKHHWFPDEFVCTSRQFAGLAWLKTQRKIARLRLGPDAGYFTRPMLEAVTRVVRGLRGADPDDGLRGEIHWMEKRKDARRQHAVV